MNELRGTTVSSYLGLTDEWCKRLDENIEKIGSTFTDPASGACHAFVEMIKQIKTEEFGNDAEYEVSDYEKKIAYMGAMVYIDTCARQIASENLSFLLNSKKSGK
jgi:hypothetical protein